MSASLLEWTLHFNLRSPEGRQFQIRPCGNLPLFLVFLNGEYILHGRIDKFKPKKKQVWEICLPDNLREPIVTYQPDDIDTFFKDLIAGKFEPELASVLPQPAGVH
jgi:hypothetical protein